jgi:hypothetical protein
MTENHGVDSSILSLATSFFSCTAPVFRRVAVSLSVVSSLQIVPDVGSLPTDCRRLLL